jgi:integrase
MPLTDISLKAAKPRATPYKLADEKGLFVLVQPSGGKLWRLKYRFNGKEKKLALGTYPDTGLKEARARRDAARKLLEAGVDPGEQKKRQKVAQALSIATSFNAVAEEFIGKMEREGAAASTITKARWFLELLEPSIGTRPVAEVTPHELLAALKKVEARGRLETAHRLRSFAGRVFRYAVATARASHNPADVLRGALTSPTVTNHAAILDPGGVGALLRALDGYEGMPETTLALKLAPHVFLRPSELRQAEWAEIDLDKAIWSLPAAKMKMKRPHEVPLSRQALEILREVQGLTGHGRFVFPSARTATRAMSENTMTAALRRLGYKSGEMTVHGFRSIASTLLNDSGLWREDVIETALAHQEADKTRGAYNRARYWSERVEMAQWWSDFLDDLKSNRGLP